MSEITEFRDEMKGMFMDMQEAVTQSFAAVNQHLDAIYKRLDAVDLRFEGIEKRLDAMDLRFEGIDKRLDAMDLRFEGIDKRLDAMDKHLKTIDFQIKKLHSDTMEGFRDLSNTISAMLEDSDKRMENIEERMNKAGTALRIRKGAIVRLKR